MKKWFGVAAIFFSSYIVFLISTMPLAFLVSSIELPKKTYLENVSGTIWQGHIGRASIEQVELDNIETDLSFWSLLILSPAIDVSFGDSMSSGPEGKFSLTASFSQIAFTEVELYLSANDIAKKLPLPFPVTAQGNAEVMLSSITFDHSDKISCVQAQGDINWSRAGVIALDNTIKLTKVSAELACEKGDVTAKLSPKNNLGLSVDARLNLARQKLSGKGYLKPGAKFPAELKPALSFLGRVDNQGRYPIKF